MVAQVGGYSFDVCASVQAGVDCGDVPDGLHLGGRGKVEWARLCLVTGGVCEGGLGIRRIAFGGGCEDGWGEGRLSRRGGADLDIDLNLMGDVLLPCGWSPSPR